MSNFDYGMLSGLLALGLSYFAWSEVRYAAVRKELDLLKIAMGDIEIQKKVAMYSDTELDRDLSKHLLSDK